MNSPHKNFDYCWYDGYRPIATWISDIVSFMYGGAQDSVQSVGINYACSKGFVHNMTQRFGDKGPFINYGVGEGVASSHEQGANIIGPPPPQEGSIVFGPPPLGVKK